MSDPFVGEIRLVPFNFAPQGWAFCSGQLLPISQNTALFSLLGTNYGGNGTSTFGLPNLQGCVAMGQGQGPGLSSYYFGYTGGSATETLLLSQIPAHSHTVPASTASGRNGVPGAAYALGTTGRGARPVYATQAEYVATPVTLSNNAAGLAGGGQPHNNMMPFLVLNYIIAMQGVFPPRS